MKIHNFEQYSDDWWAVRLGKPSASAISRVITSAGKKSTSINDYAIELANDIYVGNQTTNFTGNEHTDRGTELEPDARLSFQIETGFSVTEIGIVTDWDMCASPDGIIDIGGTLEIKCLSAKNHTKALMYINKNNKCPTAYFAQIQMQMMLLNYDFGYLYLYHPDLPCKSLKIKKDNEFCENLKKYIVELNLYKNEVLNFLNSN